MWKFSNEAGAKLWWLMKLRWFALFFQSLLFVPGIYYNFVQYKYIVFYILTLLVILFFNIFSHKKIATKSNISKNTLLYQLLFDLGAVFTLFYLSGGAQNPFIPIIFFHVSLSPLILIPRHNIIYFLLLIFFVILLHYPPAIEPSLDIDSTSILFLITRIVIAVVIWRFITWLSSILFVFRKHVRQYEEHSERLDKLRAIGAISSSFHHEFATPLNTVKLRLGRIRRQVSDGGSVDEEDFDKIDMAIEQCKIALNNIHKADLEKKEYYLQIVYIDEFIKTVADNWKRDHQNARVTICHVSKSKVCANVPPISFAKLVLSLLDNSVQQLPSVEIFITFYKKNKKLIVSFKDNAGGMSEEIYNHWGEPFNTSKLNGTGLGLYNVRNLMQAIGGDVEIINEKNRGVDVQLIFPNEETDG